MQLPAPAVLGLIYGLSEAGLAVFKRSRDDSVDADGRSLRILWATIVLSMIAGIFVSARVPQASIGGGRALYAAGVVLFVLGLVLRWYSILYLGRFFTVNVAIHSAHDVVDTGPYRLIRHPSYAGALLAFAGLALGLDNWLSLALVLVPICCAFSWRISIEENALSSALGMPYTNYMARTRRLVPYLY